MHADVTSTTPMRLIYFRGHPDEAGSALVCRVCRDYETVSRVLDGECATRTLSNLYNLHTVRGAVVGGTLRARTAMSGPHHYLGWIDPTRWCVLVEDGRGGWAYRYAARPPRRRDLRAIPPAHIRAVGGYRWVRGDSLTRGARLGYHVGSELAKELRDQAGQRDSLFDSPGVLEMDAPQLGLEPLRDAWRHDLSSFRVQVVPNDQPWRFDQHLVAHNPWARVKLRVVTYHFGEEYVPGYLMQGSGVFVERHEFIQAITPMSRACGGCVLVARERDGALDFLAVTIPYGYTLLVDAWAIHGDSTLTGLHQMAMTGNHTAMKTADTVFLKHAPSRANVRIVTPCLPGAVVPSPPLHHLLLTSDELSAAQLRAADARIKAGILQAVGWPARLVWQPVMLTLGPAWWDKTLGTSLPAAQHGDSPILGLLVVLAVLWVATMR